MLANALRRILHSASLAWLKQTKLDGADTGMFRADESGRIRRAAP